MDSFYEKTHYECDFISIFAIKRSDLPQEIIVLLISKQPDEPITAV